MHLKPECLDSSMSAMWVSSIGGSVGALSGTVETDYSISVGAESGGGGVGFSLSFRSRVHVFRLVVLLIGGGCFGSVVGGVVFL